MVNQVEAIFYAVQSYEDSNFNTLTNWAQIGSPYSAANGYFGVAFQNTASGEIVIAHRGTDGIQGGFTGDLGLDLAQNTV